ncbi:LOW QUALITY PROTEIN: hypothetical protein BJ085DRAFT_42400 [Dimargaris cristalligena]|uniref:Peptide hydrolase n=1 Tax=Dimargaris cristalligena TaxID=215637 RepID=A0A4Q0A192_9FUNG|nr:LOW QUALITY PROTEIN: hypothetical protein BJ085DRAFT_42400 [Dimargaris cristalligena]|eukprot:RKP39876.1 LOW QUALITY PROTEIN: hypothetical protein BJ085DRAFT_42400 [Dimargaris cristalligena]
MKSSLTYLLTACYAAAVASQPTGSSDKLGHERSLIQVGESHIPIWMMEQEVLGLIRSKKTFMDITGNNLLPAMVYPTEPRQKAVVQEIHQLLSPDSMRIFLTTFSSFPNRYCRSHYGVKSSDWLYNTVAELIKNNRGTLNRRVPHRRISQQSIVVRIEGQGNLASEVVVVGAHQDSINQANPYMGRSPGADDDGSGSTTIFETLSALLRAQYQPARSLEFHWYAGEEIGLVGSQDIAQDYANRNVNVRAMLQLDMTGFTDHSGNMGIVTDFVHPELTQFTRQLVHTYSNLTALDFQCGYACSDHASWSKYGFPSAMPFESNEMELNPYIHSDKDTVETVDFDHMLQFAKIATGFAVELTHTSE